MTIDNSRRPGGSGEAGKIPAVFFAVLVLVSCASSPRSAAPPGGREGFAPLAPGALVYLYIDVPKARPLLDSLPLEGIGPARMQEALDRTESAAAALYPEGAERRFLAAAKGRYPRFRAGLSFAFSPAWKKVRSETGARYWRSDRDRLSVSLSSGRALVSDGDPFARAPGTEIPRGFEEFRRDALLAGWADSAAGINRFIASLAIPIRIPADRLVFGVYAAEGRGYEAALRVETPSESHARGLAAIFSMVRMVIANTNLPEPQGSMAAALFAKAPDQEGSDLIIRTGVMDEGGIALLFTVFTVYSK
jgi:hypothetical protein